MSAVLLGLDFSDEHDVVDILELEPLEEIKPRPCECPVCDSSQFPEEWDR